LPVSLSKAKSVPHSQPAITVSPRTTGEDSVRPGRSRLQTWAPSRASSACTFPGSRVETYRYPSLNPGADALSAAISRFQRALPFLVLTEKASPLLLTAYREPAIRIGEYSRSRLPLKLHFTE
jgi:hypothetical protein